MYMLRHWSWIAKTSFPNFAIKDQWFVAYASRNGAYPLAASALLS